MTAGIYCVTDGVYGGEKVSARHDLQTAHTDLCVPSLYERQTTLTVTHCYSVTSSPNPSEDK